MTPEEKLKDSLRALRQQMGDVERLQAAMLRLRGQVYEFDEKIDGLANDLRNLRLIYEGAAACLQLYQQDH